MLVTVTGATGFIAQHIIKELLEHGYTVRGTVRDISKAKTSNPILANVELFQAELLSDSGWDEAFSGADAVFHTASPVIIDAEEASLIGPAVNGTKRVLHASTNARVKRIILTSSTAAIVNTDAEVYTEENWSQLERCSPYPKSKTLAEMAAWDFINALPEDNRPELVVLNPCVVFGPLLSNKIPQSVDLLQAILTRRMPAVPYFGFNLVDVRDVAIAHRLAFETPSASGNRYLLQSGHCWMEDIGKTLKAGFSDRGFRPPTKRIPYWLIWLAAKFHPMAKMALADIGLISNQSNSKAKAQLGWQPRDTKQTLIDTAQSLIDHGLAK